MEASAIRNFPETLNTKLRIEAIKKKLTVKELIINILAKYFDMKS